jgi:TonB family protein
MRNSGSLCALLLFSAGFAYGQGEVPPSIDSGPLTIRPVAPPSDQLSMPKPDREGVYSITPEMILPVLVKTVPAVDSGDLPSCEPRAVTVSAVIGLDGRAHIRRFFTPRSSVCASPAVLAIRQSQFQPARLNHVSVPVRVCLRVPFEEGQQAIPNVVRCPVTYHEGDGEEESDSPPIETRPTTQGFEMAPSTGAPIQVKPVGPLPDEQGAYSLGPGIVSPRLKTPMEVSSAEAESCKYPTIVSAVINPDGTIKVGGVYELNHPDDKACDNLAISAIEQSVAQPATLNGTAVPVRVCIGVPFGRPSPPVPRGTYCPRDTGASLSVDSSAALASIEANPDLARSGIKPPVLIFSPSVEYSTEARQKRIEGTVTVSLLVTDEGLPDDVQVVKGLGHGLDQIAREAVRQYRFQPATKNGYRIPVRIRADVNFRLQQKD